MQAPVLLCSVKSYCISRGSAWAGSAAAGVCTEHDYYEALLAFYRLHKRVRLPCPPCIMWGMGCAEAHHLDGAASPRRLPGWSADPLSCPPLGLPQLFPYHLSEYVCRLLRVTPFRYYRDVLADAMRDDLP